MGIQQKLSQGGGEKLATLGRNIETESILEVTASGRKAARRVILSFSKKTEKPEPASHPVIATLSNDGRKNYQSLQKLVELKSMA